MNNIVNNCCICSQIKGEEKNDLISNLLNETDYKRRIAIENDNFVVIPSLGALTPGHSLVCPKVHYRSIAQMNKNLDDSFFNILEETILVLETIYNSNVHCFEHGSAKNSLKMICTVDHAHIHLVPTNISIEKSLFQKYDWIEITNHSLESLRKIVGDNEYIYYKSPDKREFITSNSQFEFESQYMRRIFAQALNKHNEWNWRENPNAVEADEIYQSLNTYKQ